MGIGSGCDDRFLRLIRQQAVGVFVSFAIIVEKVEEKLTKANEPYLLAYGMDVDMESTGPLRFWRHNRREFGNCCGKLWMIRGMKVTYDKYSGEKVPEACWCTAIEDVTGIQAIHDAFRR